jgi:uncharacterized membrane protein
MFRTTKQLRRWIIIAVAIGVVWSVQVVPAKPPVQPWTTVALNTDPGVSSKPFDINDAGDVVGELRLASGESLAVLWEVSGTAVVEHVLADGTRASGVNELQQIVGACTTGAAYWASVNSDPVALPLADGFVCSQAYELNDEGVVVGLSADLDGKWYPVAWRVVDGEVTELLVLPGGEGYAADLTSNDDLGVAVIAGAANGRPVTWEVQSGADGSLSLVRGPDDVDRDALGHGQAFGINELGDVCGEFLFQGSSEGWSAVRALTEGSLQILQQINERQPDDVNCARCINNARQAVGNDYSKKTGDNAVLWNPNGSATQLTKVVSGWTRIYVAWAINNDGVIAAGGLRFGETLEQRALVMISPQ